VIYDGERKRTVCGTPNYIAPEILDSKGGHSYEVDFWAIGVILYTLVCGRPPFESSEVKQTYKKIRACTYHFPEHLPLGEHLKDFVRKCLKVEPQDRMNVDQMLQHEFLAAHSIPDKMPSSTLVCPPTMAFAKQFTSNMFCTEKQKLEQTAPMNLMMSTRGPIGCKLESSNELILQSARDNAQLMET
jgi:polo-like kinase 1